MVITYEVLNEDTLPILDQLERLHLLRRVPEDKVTNGPARVEDGTITSSVPTLTSNKRGKRLRRLSPETTQKWLEHLQTVRNEWDRI